VATLLDCYSLAVFFNDFSHYVFMGHQKNHWLAGAHSTIGSAKPGLKPVA